LLAYPIWKNEYVFSHTLYDECGRDVDFSIIMRMREEAKAIYARTAQ